MLDLTFSALSHPVRRGILTQLAHGATSIKELARPFRMSLPAVLKHVGILEEAGLVVTKKEGRVKTCQLQAAPLHDAVAWLETYERFWNQQFDALATYLEESNDSTTT